MFKKVFALLLCLCMVLTFVACGDKGGSSGKGGSGKVDTSLKSGTPEAPGDVYELPDIKSSGASAPVIAGCTKQAGPDDSVTVTGEGFSKSGTKVYVYSQTTKDNGKADEAKFTVLDDQNMAVTIDKSLDYSMYAIYVENSAGKSNAVLVNKPNIWWGSFRTAVSGEEYSVYGENLSTKNANETSYIYLISEDGKYCGAQVVSADPYRVTFKVPDGLTDGEKYTIRLHNGHGGENGFADAPEKVTFLKQHPVKFEGEKIDVTDFGADPKKKNNDDTASVQKAINSASEGDIIYFPKGTYLFKGNLKIKTGLKYVGDGADKSMILGSNSLEEYIFDISSGPCEFSDLGFQHLKKSGKLKDGFISVRTDEDSHDNYSVYIHDCSFSQSVSSVSRSMKFPIQIISTNGVIVENNTFESTGLIGTRDVKRAFIRNNNYKGMFYCGPYYNQNTVFIVGSDMFDVSGNYIAGKDKDTDDTGVLSSGDLSAGRFMAIQGDLRNGYFSNNKVEHTGLPDDNAGEQIMIETTWCIYEGPIKSSTETELIMPDNFTTQITKGETVLISDGKGKSQVRSVEKMKGKSVTLDKPWDIIPDENSRVIVITNNNIAIHNNYMDCYTNYLENPGATTGVQAYGGITNMFITGNTFKNMTYGTCISPHYSPTSGDTYKNPIYWSQIDNNKIESVGIGIRYNMPIGSDILTGKIPGAFCLGVVYRRNDISKCAEFDKGSWKGQGGYGIVVGEIDNVDGYVAGTKSATWQGDWLDGTIIENNKFADCQASDLVLYKHQGKTLIRNNTGASGAASVKVSPIGKAPISVNY